jgi:hypothetical protein
MGRQMTRGSESSIVRVANHTVGRGIAGVFFAIKFARGPRPIHPRGEIFVGQVERLSGKPENAGISWIDSQSSSNQQDVTVRVPLSGVHSHSSPEMIVLAFGFATEQGDADLMLASTWLGIRGRYVLRLGWSATGNLASLMLYRSEFGPVEIAARTVGNRDEQWNIELLHASSSSNGEDLPLCTSMAIYCPTVRTCRLIRCGTLCPGAETNLWAGRLR